MGRERKKRERVANKTTTTTTAERVLGTQPSYLVLHPVSQACCTSEIGAVVLVTSFTNHNSNTYIYIYNFKVEKLGSVASRSHLRKKQCTVRKLDICEAQLGKIQNKHFYAKLILKSSRACLAIAM